MDFWKIMNLVAWGLCGIIAFLLVSDAIRVERTKAKNNKEQSDTP